MNIHRINMPQWGLEMTEGTIAAWHIAPGSKIEKGTELVDIETSKIVSTMEAMADMPGVVRRLLGKVGDTLAVGGLLGVTADPEVSEAEIDAFLGAEGVAGASLPAAGPASSPAAVPAPAPAVAPAVAGEAAVPGHPVATPTPQAVPPSGEELVRLIAANAAAKASPVARRHANRAGIDLSSVAGSGRHDRVSLDDVLALAPAVAATPASLAPLSAQQLAERNERAHASPVARRLANRLALDLSGLEGSGRGGRISVADVEALRPRLIESVPALAAAPRLAVVASDVRAGPAARKLALDHGLDLGQVKATGPRNLVLKSDVLDSIRDAQQPAAEQQDTEFDLLPLTPMRKAIAASLTLSKQTVPHFYLTVDLQLDALMALRQAINTQNEGRRKLSINDFLMRAVALALREVPAANVQYTEGGIRQFHAVHLCLAVAIEGGLVTPVIRDAERKSVFAIAEEIVGLAERARARRLTREELGGGTFTVSNLGMFGVRQFDAVINPPQGGILAVGSVRREAFEGLEGGIEFRSLMSVTMSCDHRAIDGAVGAAFLAALRKWVDRPYALLG